LSKKTTIGYSLVDTTTGIEIAMNFAKDQSLVCAVLFFSITFMAASASAADRIEGRVEGGGSPIVKADVTLWATMSGAPESLPRRRRRTTDASS
jgi:hypothetical protein